MPRLGLLAQSQTSGTSPVMTTFIPIPRVFVGQTVRPSATISYAAPQL